MIFIAVNLPEAGIVPARTGSLLHSFFFHVHVSRLTVLLVFLLMASCSASPRYILTGSGDTAGVLEERIRCPKNIDTPAQEKHPFLTKGKASYYGDKFQGRKTASGELYDRSLFTAAHRTLPFGTTVRVINLLNNKSVVVRVNDRGPHKRTRIIDLSYAAAETIGMLSRGIIPVEIEITNE